MVHWVWKLYMFNAQIRQGKYIYTECSAQSMENECIQSNTASCDMFLFGGTKWSILGYNAKN